MNKPILLLTLASLVAGGIYVTGISHAQSIDIHQINAQIYGDKNMTNGIPSYLTNESPTGVLPSSLLITARSPGNSTLSLEVNGSYITDAQGIPLHNFAFSNITTEYFSVPVANETFIITVHSSDLNYTRTFHYQGNVKTPTQFINYETAKKVYPTILGMSPIAAFLLFAPSTAAGVYAAYEVAFFYAKWKRSHPNLADKVIGGMGNEE